MVVEPGSSFGTVTPPSECSSGPEHCTQGVEPSPTRRDGNVIPLPKISIVWEQNCLFRDRVPIANVGPSDVGPERSVQLVAVREFGRLNEGFVGMGVLVESDGGDVRAEGRCRSVFDGLLQLCRPAA